MTKHIVFPLGVLLLGVTFMGCATNDDGIDIGPGGTCQGDHCVCVGDNACSHECTAGAPECHVEGAAHAVSVKCNNNDECHVECSGASSCSVDCGGSTECHVTCPGDAPCSVDHCEGPGCVVSCGTNGEATYANGHASCN